MLDCRYGIRGGMPRKYPNAKLPAARRTEAGDAGRRRVAALHSVTQERTAARKSPNAKLPAAHRTEAGDAGRMRFYWHKGSRIKLETSQSVQEESTGPKH